MQDLPMGDQEAAREAALASVAAQRDAKAKASPPATSAEDVQQPDIPPPSHAPELDNPKSDSTPMEIDQQQASIEEPSKDPVDEPSIVIQTEPTEPDQPSMATPQPTSTATPSRGGSASARGSRSNKSVSFPVIGEDTPTAMTDATPSSARRGRPPGRPRGSRARGPTRGITRGSRGGSRGGRGGKRKRADDDEGDDGASSDSETYAPTTTKSGRNVQKPTTFVPPPQPSPPPMPSFKKKRVYRRNPESAVCKTCLRGVSPASNMIVFCDGCNVPYHRYCHQPPIDQSVIDEVDKEWYCKQCERERIQPVPEAHVVGFVAAENASAEERQKYFSNLPPGLLVTLLTKATTLHPDLPVFDPSFQPTGATSAGSTAPQSTENGHTKAPIQPLPIPTAPILRDAEDSDDDLYGSDEHPPHYPRPGQGLMSTLPPEKNDLHYLVDEENSRGVFTHVYQVDQNAEEKDVSVGAGEQ